MNVIEIGNTGVRFQYDTIDIVLLVAAIAAAGYVWWRGRAAKREREHR